jgi:hypothetical protein
VGLDTFQRRQSASSLGSRPPALAYLPASISLRRVSEMGLCLLIGEWILKKM